MSVVASIISDLVKAGVDPDLVGRVASALAQREPVETRTARQELYKPHPDVSAKEWLSLREKVFERDAWVCVYCGDAPSSPQCDHVVPITRGGKSTVDNLVTSCKRCNSSKKGKTSEEWRRM